MNGAGEYGRPSGSPGGAERENSVGWHGLHLAGESWVRWNRGAVVANPKRRKQKSATDSRLDPDPMRCWHDDDAEEVWAVMTPQLSS